MFNKYIYVACSLLSLSPFAMAQSEIPTTSIFSFNGFGTFGLVHSSESKADYISSSVKPNGAGYSHSWSSDIDSRLGLQMNANFSKSFSAVVQVVSEQSYDNSYKPILEWANLKYQVTPDFNVRIGRIALPLFLAADYRKVGYAYPWARMPVEVYGAVPFTNSDGVDAIYRSRWGSVKNTTQAFLGKSKIKFANNGIVDVKNLKGIANTTDIGFASVRVNYLLADVSVNLGRPLFDAFRQFGPQGNAISDKYDSLNKRATMLSIGANYDPGEWFVMGEWGRLKTNSFLGNKSTWYVGGGYRINNLTPYLSVMNVKVDSNTYEPGLNTSMLPPFLVQTAAGLNASLNAVLASTVAQHTVSTGVRWDFRKDVALKLQYDRVQPKSGSPGTFTNIQPGYKKGEPVNVMSVILDFVF